MSGYSRNRGVVTARFNDWRFTADALREIADELDTIRRGDVPLPERRIYRHSGEFSRWIRVLAL